MKTLEINLGVFQVCQTIGMHRKPPFTLHDIRWGCSHPYTWGCVDCGENTAPGMATAKEMLEAVNAGRSVRQKIDKRSEVYTTTMSVWHAARMGDHEGCLCVGCLEKRLGRMLNREDFIPRHPFHGPRFPRTKRLNDRLEREPDTLALAA
jgi:hypothetical protein